MTLSSEIEIRITSQHAREISGATLLNSDDAPSHIHLIPEPTFTRTTISLIEEEVSIQSPAIEPIPDEEDFITNRPAIPTASNACVEGAVLQARPDAPISEEAKSVVEVRRPSTSSGNGEAVWEKVVEMMEKRHENEVADLREEHEVNVDEKNEEIRRLQRHLKMAHKKCERTQMRVNGLLEGHSALKTQIQSSEQTLQEVVASSQALQAQYDELKSKQDSTEELAQDPPLEGPSTQASEQEIKPGDSGPVHNEEDRDINQLRQGLLLMATDLAKAHDENRAYASQIYELRRALEANPKIDIGLQTVVEYKDKELRDLQTTASECTIAFNRLEKKSAEDSKLANEEIAALQTQLADDKSSISTLQTSKDQFQAWSEQILAMLKGKVYQNDLIEAMDGYFQTTVKDNQILASGGKAQADQIEEMFQSMSTLRAESLQAKRLLEEKEDLCAELTADMREKENELGGLQIKLEAFEHDHEKVLAEKNGAIAAMEREAAQILEGVQHLMDSTADESSRAYIQLKKQEAASAEARSREYFNDINKLQQQLAELQQEDRLQKCIVYYNQQKYHQDEVRLKEAEYELGFLRAETELQRKLPHNINITEVLEEREELQAARKKIRDYERELRNSQGRLAATIVQSKERSKILELKVVGFQILVQLAELNEEFKDRNEGAAFEEVNAFLDECCFQLNNADKIDGGESEVNGSGEPEELEGHEEHEEPQEHEEHREHDERDESKESPAHNEELMSSKRAGKQRAIEGLVSIQQTFLEQNVSDCAEDREIQEASQKQDVDDSAETESNMENSMNLTHTQWALKYSPEVDFF